MLNPVDSASNRFSNVNHLESNCSETFFIISSVDKPFT